MALDMQGLRLTNDHTLESASEVMSQLQFERRLPNGRDAYQQLLRNLGFRSEQDGVEHKQFVFQGQCLILGDARVGKTSLKKSLMGKPFDVDEPGTKGVEISLVDRKWRHLHVIEGLKFGSFARFRESALYQGVMFGPGGVEFTFDAELTSQMSAIAYLFFMLLRLCWLLSFIWLLAFGTMDIGCCAFSIVALLLELFLQHFLPSDHPQFANLGILFLALPRSIMGLGTAHLLSGIFTGIDCQKLDSSFEGSTTNGRQFIWVVHLLIVAMLVNGISTYFFFLMLKYFRDANIWGWVESAVPGQVQLSDPLPLLPVLFLLMIPVACSFAYGCVIEITSDMTALEYCYILHFMMIPIFCLVIIRLTQTLCGWANFIGINLNFILAFYIIMETMTEYVNVSITSFCPSTTNVVIFAGWACYTVYKDWDMFFLFNDIQFINARETQASFTFIFIEKVLLNFQKLRKALHNMFSSLKLKILDFSGDEEYYAYHHIFLREQAIYIVVFNIANFADDNFSNLVAKIQRINFWLESICSKAASKTPIFLVGTHRGHMDKTCLKSIDKHLRQNLLDSFDDELVRNDNDNLLHFPIENSHGKNDRGVQILQRKIMSTAEEHKTTMGREIPFSWIKIQDAIINQRKNKKAKFCVTLEQFPISVGNFICSNWSKETLKYFHEKGLVIYVDPGSSSETQGFNGEGNGEDDPGQDSKLSNWILLKPEILIDIIIQLVTPLTEEEKTSWHGCRRDLKLLQNTGMLTDPLLRKFLSKWKENEEAIKGFLEEYDIICPLFYNVKNKEEAKVTHFVPSLLPLSVDGNTPVWHDDTTDKRFFVFFKRFLPDPLFHHLLSRAHRHSNAGFPKGQPVIYRDAGMFWFTPTQPYRLLVLKKENMIEVTFRCRDGQGMRPSDVLSLVFSMVQGICQRHFPYVTFHCGPACPSDRCPGYQGDYISHPGVQKSSSRPHVFDVLPARQEDSISSFYCVNQNFENDLQDWLL